MRKNACLTALLLCLALFCAACGARIPHGTDGEHTGPDQTAPASAPGQALPVVVAEPPETASPGPFPEEPDAVDGGTEKGEEPAEPVQAADPSPDSKAKSDGVKEPDGAEGTSDGTEGTPGDKEVPDYSGCYRDMQGTDVVYSDLTLSRQEEGNGLYDASIGLYRLAFLEGIAQVQEDGTLLFVGGPPKVQAVITIDAEQAAVEFTVSEFEYIHPGDVYTFPDGKA